MPPRLSKSKYTDGLQCHRQLWWKVHEPRAPELTPGPSLQALFDMGNRVGERARQEFPGATLIDLDYRRPHRAVEATRLAIEEGATDIRMLSGELPGELPDVAPGPHCTTPYECPFLARCHAPAPDHAIEELNGIRARALAELRERGIETIEQIPSDFPLKPLHARHRAAVLQNNVVIEPGLRRALAAYRYPIAMLDFETVGPALPVWNGCSPLTAVPVQFSVHTLHENGELDVADGMAASHLLESVLCHPDELSAEQCENLRTQLCKYCEHDTAVMVELLRFLQALAPRAG